MSLANARNQADEVGENMQRQINNLERENANLTNQVREKDARINGLRDELALNASGWTQPRGTRFFNCKCNYKQLKILAVVQRWKLKEFVRSLNLPKSGNFTGKDERFRKYGS